MPGAAGRQGRGGRRRLGLVVAGVVVAGAGTVSAVALTGGDETPKKRAEPSVSAAPPAWTVEAGRQLKSGTGLRYEGTMTVGGRPVQARLRVTPAGLATGRLSAGGLKADVVAIGGDTYIKAGEAFWRGYVTGVTKVEYYAGRWSKAPVSVPGFDVPDVLGPESIARLLAKAPARPPTEAVNGVAAFKVATPEAEYLVEAAAPHRLLSVRAAGPNAPQFAVARVAAPKTLFDELRPRVAKLGGAVDPGLRFRLGSLTFSHCDQNPSGCTASVPVTLTTPQGAVPKGARAALRASITSRGEPLGSCTESKPVPEDRALVLRCTVSSKRWRDWMRNALDNPGSYPYAATARVVGEAVAEDAVDKLLARVDKERTAVLKRVPKRGPSSSGPPESVEPSVHRSEAPQAAESRSPRP